MEDQTATEALAAVVEELARLGKAVERLTDLVLCRRMLEDAGLGDIKDGDAA